MSQSCLFQFTLPRGERPIRSSIGRHSRRFNSRSRVGSDSCLRRQVADGRVSIHAPAWGATVGDGKDGRIAGVSIHAPAWGATGHQIALQSVGAVSIHAPAWGATRRVWVVLAGLSVSIHAPAWGATERHQLERRQCRVSIHAPAWGATSSGSIACLPRPFQFTLPRGERPPSRLAQRELYSFNSRSRVGSDFGTRFRVASSVVSIHAPAWGATRSPMPGRRDITKFQFTLPRGERLRPRERRSKIVMFQFTLPRGERPLISRLLPLNPCFNSRSRVGSDVTKKIYGPSSDVSIHAPAWGATRGALLGTTAGRVSIHAPAWGATRRADSPGRGPASFNSRSRVGSDEGNSRNFVKFGSFNSRSRVGSDALRRRPFSTWLTFQFTLPRGERLNKWERMAPGPEFQFTLPRGERLPHAARLPLANGFNSRSRVGSDPSGSALLSRTSGFNSRSRVGSDRGGIRRVSMADYSVFCAEYNTN